MELEYISVRGAREHNLRDVSVRVPKRRITVFTGVSGSGKSSLVFDTIAAEAQRQLNETFTAFARARLPQYGQPDADAIEHLSTAVIIDQKRLGGGPRSTVGTITDINPLLRLLWSRVGEPAVEASWHLSFNEPAGMCPECSGLGRRTTVDVSKVFDRRKSLREGAILLPNYAPGTWYHQMYVAAGLFDNDKPLEQFSDEEWNQLLYGKGGKVTLGDPNGLNVQSDYEGVIVRFQRLAINRDASETSESAQQANARFTTTEECPVCHGARLNAAALACRIDGRNIADATALDITALLRFLANVDGPVAKPLVEAASARLRHMEDMGLGYLTLERETSTLSGGESQRIKMVRHLGSALVDVMYVFDEPTIGLHPRDVHRLNRLLVQLRDKGNTVLVVEHDPDVMEIADHVIDLGPGAGAEGGRITYEGDVAGLRDSDTLTGAFLGRRAELKAQPRTPTGHLRIEHAGLHNLRDVTVDVPLGVLTAVTGVAGSGKSSLIHGVLLERHPELIAIDQSAIRTSTRSTASTYLGIMDPIRRRFAKANGVKPGLFSFNSVGACEECKGLGLIHTDLAFMDPVQTPCQRCGGRRFKDEVLRLTLDGRSISDVLDLTAAQALDVFTSRDIAPRLRAMVDVGLSYLTLGQSLSTLSGGECQRLKLADDLHRQGSVYVLDEPTTGLHMADVGTLLTLLDRLVEEGSSVIVIEHNLSVIAAADWVIDLGPEGGDRGGQVVFTGTPAELVRHTGSLTGEHLRREVSR